MVPKYMLIFATVKNQFVVPGHYYLLILKSLLKYIGAIIGPLFFSTRTVI
jgi:hypothetical protein